MSARRHAICATQARRPDPRLEILPGHREKIGRDASRLACSVATLVRTTASHLRCYPRCGLARGRRGRMTGRFGTCVPQPSPPQRHPVCHVSNARHPNTRIDPLPGHRDRMSGCFETRSTQPSPARRHPICLFSKPDTQTQGLTFYLATMAGCPDASLPFLKMSLHLPLQQPLLPLQGLTICAGRGRGISRRKKRRRSNNTMMRIHRRW
jgi:hypothetical protein